MGRMLLSHPLQVVEYTIQQLPLPPNKLCNTLFSTLLTSPSSLLPLLTPSLSTSLLTASFTKLWVYDALAKVTFCQLCDRYSGFQAALFYCCAVVDHYFLFSADRKTNLYYGCTAVRMKVFL